MKQRRQSTPKGQPQRITKAVTHIRLLEVNPGKLTALDTLAPVYSAGTPHEGSFIPVLRQKFPVLKRKLLTLWTTSYFVSTVGGAPLSVIKQHIGNQKHV